MSGVNLLEWRRKKLSQRSVNIIATGVLIFNSLNDKHLYQP